MIVKVIQRTLLFGLFILGVAAFFREVSDDEAGLSFSATGDGTENSNPRPEQGNEEKPEEPVPQKGPPKDSKGSSDSGEKSSNAQSVKDSSSHVDGKGPQANRSHAGDVLAKRSHGADDKPVAALARSADSDRCIVGAAAMEDLTRQREEIEAHRKVLVEKESELTNFEKALKEEIKGLEVLRSEIIKHKEQNKKEQQEKVTKLVETLDSMNPKSASQLLSALDENLAIIVMYQTSTQKLAKIMSAMETQKSSRLTELLAGVVRSRTSDTKPVGSAVSAEGGTVAASKAGLAAATKAGEP